DGAATALLDLFTSPAPTLHSTLTAVSCTSPVAVSQGSSCFVTVVDTAGQTTPTGSITFSSSGTSGSFSGATCTLVSGSCSILFTGTAAGTAILTAAYGGDVARAASSGTATVAVVNPSTGTGPSAVFVSNPAKPTSGQS